MSEFSKSQLDRLGGRLRKTNPPASADVDTYFAYREGYTTAFNEVMARLASLFQAAPPSGRRKTLDSVIAKMRRSKTRLSRMQDIAGRRVVVPGLEQQDSAVAEIQQPFQALRADDLRKTPHSGYRAVHVIVTASDGHVLELQVRTQLQDIYAELVEKMADEFGITLKYGGGDSFAREILASASKRAYELDLAKRTIAIAKTVRPASARHQIVEQSRNIEEAERRFRTTVRALTESLGGRQEREQ